MPSEEKKQLPEPPSVVTSLAELTDDVVVDIIARVPRCNYPTLSLVSRRFRSVVASSELYERRSSLGCTEQSLYVCLFSAGASEFRWYVLRRKGNGYRLVLIPSLPRLCSRGSIVSVGSKIYVLCSRCSPSALAIDCRSHRFQPLSAMPRPMSNTIAEAIEKKIYVIGDCKSDDSKKRVLVFDTETQMYEPEMTKSEMEVSHSLSDMSSCVVMADKMYTRDDNKSFVYDPKVSKWETEEMLNEEDWLNACVLDDILYYFDRSKNKIRTYDPKSRFWGVVKGVEDLFPEIDTSSSDASSFWDRTVGYGGKLALFLPNKHTSGFPEGILFVEIAMEKRRGEIWGKVERCDVVFDGAFILKKSLAVMV